MIRRILIAAAILAVLSFAIEGGQWGTWDLWKQRRQKNALQHEIDSLAHKVDSLRRYRVQLDTDRSLQERLARENVGMVRGDKELLYLIGPPDSSARRPKKP